MLTAHREAYRLRLDAVGYFTYALAMVLVPLKLWCRRRAGGLSNIGLDDYLTVVSLLVANGFFWTCMIGMRPLLGRHVDDLPDPMLLVGFLRNIWVAQILYTFAIASIKLAVLAFYWRLFAVHASIVIWAMAGLCIAWFLAILLCVIFNCLPVQAAWDVTITHAKCIPIRSIYLGGSVPNVLLDLVVVLMPLPYVWRLHAPLAQRLLLAGMFILGAFIAVVSLVRLIIFLRIPIATSGDVTHNFRAIIIWSIVEIHIGLVCACLPSLKPAFAAIGLHRLFSLTSSRVSATSPYPSHPASSSRASRPRKKGSTGGLFSTIAGLTRSDSEEELKAIDGACGINQTEIAMRRSGDDDDDDDDDSGSQPRPSHGINVQRDWGVHVDNKSSV